MSDPGPSEPSGSSASQEPKAAKAPDNERARRLASFDADALAYEQARPVYPERLFDDLVALSGVPAQGAVLEIGSGTGKAALPLAQRGFHLLGVELGANMATIARQKLAAYPNARVVVADFEQYPLPAAAFDLAVAASAWHWIDPAIGYPKVAQALKPGGALALLWNSRWRQSRVSGEAGRADDAADQPAAQSAQAASDAQHDLGTYAAFQEAAREVTRQIAPQLARPVGERGGERRRWRHRRSHEDMAADAAEDVSISAYFAAPVVRTYAWTATYDASAYMRLLDSYSSYRILDPATRERLYAALTALIDDRFGGRVRIPWQAELYLAQRR